MGRLFALQTDIFYSAGEKGACRNDDGVALKKTILNAKGRSSGHQCYN